MIRAERMIGSMIDFCEVFDRRQFLAEARANPREYNLGDPYFFDAEEEKVHPVRIFENKDWSCGGVLAGKQIAMVYNNGKKGQGVSCIRELVRQGGRWLNADEGFLTRYYDSLGFIEICRGKFGPEFFPERWDAENYGMPDVVFMAHKFYMRPLFVGESAGYMKTWDEAVILMDSLT
jgi:hypothetical protein